MRSTCFALPLMLLLLANTAPPGSEPGGRAEVSRSDDQRSEPSPASAAEPDPVSPPQEADAELEELELGVLGDLRALAEWGERQVAVLDAVKATLEKTEVEGLAGNGLVKIRATGLGVILGVTIDETLLKPSKKAAVEKLVADALVDVRNKVEQASEAELAKHPDEPPPLQSRRR